MTDDLLNDFYDLALVGGATSYLRPDWHEWGLWLAAAVSLRADCRKRRCGAVIMDDWHRIVGQGYNGTAPGGPSCLRGECPRAFSGAPPGSSYDTGPGACVGTHAEMNAVLDAGLVRSRGAVVYVTSVPCEGCQKIMDSAGIRKIFWPGGNLEYGP